MSDVQGDQNLKTDVQPSWDGTRTSEGNMGTSCQTHATGASGAKSKSRRSGCLGWVGLSVLVISEMANGLSKVLIGTVGVVVAYWIIMKPLSVARAAAQGAAYPLRRFWGNWNRRSGETPSLRMATPQWMFWTTFAKVMLRYGLITAGCLPAIFVVVFITDMVASARIYAPYFNEASPVVDNLARQVDLFRVDNGTFPGVDSKLENSLITRDGTALLTSALAPNRKGLTGKETLQTFVLQGADYVPAVAKWNGTGLQIRPVAPEDATNHFAVELKCEMANFLGRALRPNHIMYRVDGYSERLYIFARGAFGDGHGLASGTCCAFLNICNPCFKGPISSGWKYMLWGCEPLVCAGPKRCKGGQMALLSAQEWPGVPGEKDNVCWIGDVSSNGLLSCDPRQVHRALEELKAAGWLGLEESLAETDQ